MSACVDLTGMTFGKLLVTRREGITKWGKATWLCSCECGGSAVIDTSSLRRGLSKTCGCSHVKHNNTWKGGATREYFSWMAMLQRCRNPRSHKYALYGGRGITVAEQWSDFRVFLKDMGPRPEGTSIDRIDPDGNYEPSNCRWATVLEQRANRRDSRRSV